MSLVTVATMPSKWHRGVSGTKTFGSLYPDFASACGSGLGCRVRIRAGPAGGWRSRRQAGATVIMTGPGHGQPIPSGYHRPNGSRAVTAIAVNSRVR